MSELNAKEDLGIDVGSNEVIVEGQTPVEEPEKTPPVVAKDDEKPEEGKEVTEEKPEDIEKEDAPEDKPEQASEAGKLLAKQRIKLKAKIQAERNARLALEAELQSLKAQVQPQHQIQTEGQPLREQFQTDEEYFIAMGRYGARQELLESQAKQEQSSRELAERQAAEEFQELVTERIEEANKEFPDFEEVMEESEDELNPILNSSKFDLRAAILENDNFPKLAYYFAKKPGELKTIAALPERKAIAELTRLGDKLAAKAPKTPSTAPPPIKPTGGSGGVDAPLETLKGEALRERMAKQGIL